MADQSGGQAVVEALRAAGVEVTFGIPAQLNLPIYDAFLDPPGLPQVLARHELGAAYMADGYARASGRPGVLNVVGGPGLTNALTGILEAGSACSPLLVLTTTVATSVRGQSRSVTHEFAGQEDVAVAAGVWHQRVTSRAGLGPAIAAAVAALAAGRPGPAVVELPADLLTAIGPAAPGPDAAGRAGWPPGRPAAEDAPAWGPAGDAAEVRRAAELLADATRPVIWAGGGAVGAGPDLIALAELLGAPVFTTDGSLGLLPDDHPLALGAGWVAGDPVEQILSGADVLLAVGTSFSAYMTDDWSLRLTGQLVRVDIDAGALGRCYPCHVGIHADARAAVPALLAALRPLAGPAPRAGAADAVRTARRSARAAGEQEAATRTLTPGGTVLDLVDGLRSALPRDGILTVDSLVGYWITRFFPGYRPRSVHLAMAYGSLGFALPAAIGARIARPGRPVVAVAGDGAFMFTAQELGTAVQEDLPIPVVVYNDGGHGSIRWNQRHRFGRTVAADLRQPDLVMLARAFGADAIRLTDARQTSAAVADALRGSRPTLIEVPLSIEPPFLRLGADKRAAPPPEPIDKE